MLNSRLGRFTATRSSAPRKGGWPARASLLPKLRDQYAEFLDHVSLVHLRLLASPTCVGLRYGHLLVSRLSFSCLSTPQDSARGSPRSPRTPVSGIAPLRRWTATSTRPLLLRSSVPQTFNDHEMGPECQPARHRLRLWGLALGPASPCADCHGAGTLGLTVRGVFTRVCAYSFRHPHFRSLQDNGSPVPSLLPERSPTPVTKSQGQASAGRLIPTILGAFTLDW